MTEQLCAFETCKLAREKGFEEVVRHIWISSISDTVAVNPPSDEEMISRFLAMAKKYKGDYSSLEKLYDLEKAKPLHNSRLPENFYARPTQDLLERWLREVHGIMIAMDCMQAYKFAFTLGEIATIQNRGYGDEFDAYELAREAALVHALKLLPDAKTT